MAELNGKTIEEYANRVLGYVTGSSIGAMIFLGIKSDSIAPWTTRVR